MNAFVDVPLAPPGLVTVTLRASSVAPMVIVMFAVTWPAVLNVVLFTVIPLPLKLAPAPLAKFVPVITTFSVAPLAPCVGFTAVTVGAALAVNVAVQARSAAGIAKEGAHGLGLQPANTDPLAGVAVSVTGAPAGYEPPPDTAPLPVPAVASVRANIGGGPPPRPGSGVKASTGPGTRGARR